MDAEQVSREMNEIQQKLKDDKLEIEMKDCNLRQLMEENDTLNSQIEKIEEETTAKIEELEQDRYSLRMQLDQQKKLYENALETIESDALQHKSVVETLKVEYNVKVDQLTKEVVSLHGLQCELESSRMSELQLSQRVKDLELTVRRLEAESNSQSEALGDSCSDAMESDFVRDLMADYKKLSEECSGLQMATSQLKCQLECCQKKLDAKERELQELQCQTVEYCNTLAKSREEVKELKAELEVLTMEGNPLNPKGNSLFSEVEDRRVAAEKALLSVQVKNDSLMRQLELEKQKIQQLKMQIASLLQLTTVKVDARHLQSVTQQLSQATGEIQMLASQLHTSQLETESLKKQIAHLSSDGNGDHYVQYLESMLEKKDKELSAVQKDLQTRQLRMFAETENLRRCEQRAYSAEQQVAALQSANVKLQLCVDELRMKYEPGAVVTGTRRRVKFEKIPLFPESVSDADSLKATQTKDNCHESLSTAETVSSGDDDARKNDRKMSLSSDTLLPVSHSMKPSQTEDTSTKAHDMIHSATANIERHSSPSFASDMEGVECDERKEGKSLPILCALNGDFEESPAEVATDELSLNSVPTLKDAVDTGAQIGHRSHGDGDIAGRRQESREKRKPKVINIQGTTSSGDEYCKTQ